MGRSYFDGPIRVAAFPSRRTTVVFRAGPAANCCRNRLLAQIDRQEFLYYILTDVELDVSCIGADQRLPAGVAEFNE